MYTWLLFYRRFKNVWIRQEYVPQPNSRTIYYLNHNSWWDGLIPLLLNEYRFQQKARALMEDRQMQQYPFFKKIGAFSINRTVPRKTISSLRYAVKSMCRPHSSLFIYPEGKIRAAGSPLSFEGGLAWLHSKIPDVDWVPIGIHIHTIQSDKPELYLHIGNPVQMNSTFSTQVKTELFEQKLTNLLEQLFQTAGFDNNIYERFL